MKTEDLLTNPPQIKPPIAIIGAGGVVNDAHLPAYQKAGFEVTTIYDLDSEKAHKLANKFDIPLVARNLDEFINEAQDHECVFDLALPAQVTLQVLPAIPSHSGVLMQKPMGENLKQAREILQICHDNELTAGVNLQLRHAPFIVAARQLIDDGKIGELHDIAINMCVYTPWQLWDFLFEASRVEIPYHSIHYIDLVRLFFGNPQKVYAKTIKHPKMKDLASTRSTIILDYGAFKNATIHTNHGHEFGSKHQESHIKFEGTEGAIKIRVGVNLDYPRGRPDLFEWVSLGDDGDWKEKRIEGSWFPDAFVGPMSGLMKKLEEPEYCYINDVNDAIHTMEVVEAAYISSQEGGINPSSINHD